MDTVCFRYKEVSSEISQHCVCLASCKILCGPLHQNLHAISILANILMLQLYTYALGLCACITTLNAALYAVFHVNLWTLRCHDDAEQLRLSFLLAYSYLALTMLNLRRHKML